MHNERFYSGAKKFDYERSLKKHIGKTITEEDDALIRRYIEEAQATKHISEGRAKKLGFTLIGWRRFIKLPYSQITITEVYKGITALKNGNSEKGEPFKVNTQRDFIKILKAYLIWLNDEKITTLDERKIRGIKSPGADYRTESAEDLLTAEEIVKIVDGCRNPRDKAFIFSLYETGARIGELARLTWKDLTINGKTIKVRLDDEKTHKNRIAYLVSGMGYMIDYKNGLGNVSADDFVFKVSGDKPMSYSISVKIIRMAAKRAGITKDVHPHLFRKSRITNMIKEGYKEAVIRESMWGNQSTQQFRAYVQLADSDLEKEVLEKAGILGEEEKKPPATRPIKCICGRIGKPTERFCPDCGRALREDAADQLREAEEQAELLPEYQDLLKEFEVKLRAAQAAALAKNQR